MYTSKYFSFCNPKLYPIMDSYVKKAIGIPESCNYGKYCAMIGEFKRQLDEKVHHEYSIKEIDMFLWQWVKDLAKDEKQ